MKSSTFLLVALLCAAISVTVAISGYVRVQKDYADLFIKHQALTASYNDGIKQNEKLIAEKNDLEIKFSNDIRAIVENLDMLNNIASLKNKLILDPVESLTELDLVKLINDTKNSIPKGSPFGNDGGYHVSASFGDGVVEGRWRTHRGVDLLPKGHEGYLYPTMKGTIIDIGINDIYGKYILIDHGEYQTFYAHLDTIYWIDAEKQTVVGEEVDESVRIGKFGNTGYVASHYGGNGSHLHYEIRIFDQRQNAYIPINPLPFIKVGEGDLP